MKLGISEILQRVSKAKTKAAKVAVLHQNNSMQLRTWLKVGFCPTVEWDLPAGNPPYKASDHLDGRGAMYVEAEKLYIYLKGMSPVSQARREILFINLLESVTAEDAKVILAFKDKQSPYKGVTKSVINEAFPGLIENVEATA